MKGQSTPDDCPNCFLLYSSQLGIELGNSIRSTDLIVDILTDDTIDYL